MADQRKKLQFIPGMAIMMKDAEGNNLLKGNGGLKLDDQVGFSTRVGVSGWRAGVAVDYSLGPTKPKRQKSNDETSYSVFESFKGNAA